MSRSNLGEAVMTFSGDDRPFQQAADRVERAMRGVAGFMGEATRSIEDGFRSLGSNIDNVGDSVIKFGSFFRARVLVNGLEEMAKAAAEFRKEIDLGHASLQDMFRGVVDKIPIVGQFAQAGRAIREAVTGDDAAVAVMKQATEEQNSRLELTNRIILAVRTLRREEEETRRKLDAHPGDTFTTLVGQVTGRGASASAKAKQDADTAHAAEFAAIDKEKTGIAEKIRLAQEAIFKRTQATGSVGEGDIRNVTSTEIKGLQAQFAAIEKRSNELRAQIDATVNTAKEKIGHETFTDIGRLLGGEFAKSLQHGTAALKEWYHNLTEIDPVTKHMADNFAASLQRMAGNIGTFRGQMAALTEDLKNNQIGADLFDKLSQKATFDQLARSIGSMFDQFAPITETVGRLIDSNIGGPFRKIFGALGQVGEMFTGKMNLKEPKELKVPEFRAQLVGLEQLHDRIQAAAASGGGIGSVDRTQDDILGAVKDTAKEAKRQSELLAKIAAKPPYAPVGP
jgi:hypothetical protein